MLEGIFVCLIDKSNLPKVCHLPPPGTFLISQGCPGPRSCPFNALFNYLCPNHLAEKFCKIPNEHMLSFLDSKIHAMLHNDIYKNVF